MHGDAMLPDLEHGGPPPGLYIHHGGRSDAYTSSMHDGVYAPEYLGAGIMQSALQTA